MTKKIRIGRKSTDTIVEGLRIRDMNNLQKRVEAQRLLLVPLIKGERCIYKHCPFFKKDVPEA